MLYYKNLKYEIKNIKYYLSIILIIFLISLIIIFLDVNIVFYHAFAISSFSSVSFEDVYYPCSQFGYNNYASENIMIEADCLDATDWTKLYNLSLPVDIIGINYLSSGETFNATFWLDYPLYDDKYSDYVDANLTFIMSISNILRGGYGTTLNPTNFIYIYPERDGNWTYQLFEADPFDYQLFEADPYEGTKGRLIETNPFDYQLFEADPYEGTKGRLIETNYNYNNFIQNGKKIVHMPFDLNSIGNPEEFAVQFRMSVDTDYSELNFLKNKGKEYLIDTTNWDYIPPTKPQITSNLPDVTVAAGDVKKVDEPVSINTVGLNAEERMLLSDGNKDDGITLSFNPSQIDLPLNGTRYTEMTIETSKELEPKTYNDIPVNITTGLINHDNLTDLIAPISYNEAVTIQLLHPVPPLDKLNTSFLDKYGISIYIILFSLPLVITTFFAIILSRRFNHQIILDKIGIQDLLTIDGSVIVGVLILLTLNTAEVNLREASVLIAILTTTIIIPFALSALITLIKGSVELGIKLAIPGFIYLMVSIVLIVYIFSLL